MAEGYFEIQLIFITNERFVRRSCKNGLTSLKKCAKIAKYYMGNEYAWGR